MQASCSFKVDIDNSQMCNMISIECQKNDDSLHANVKKYHTIYYICNPARLLMC